MGAFSRANSATRPKSVKAAISGITLLGVSALVLSGCASTPDADSGSAEDLTLKFGSILPQTGSLAQLGPPEFAGVDLAIKEINDADAGIEVSVEHKDSGDTTTDIATQSATALIADNVSVIIGAASSGVSKTFIDQVTQAGIVQISPANTSPDFTDYPDDGYYFRTAPSDVLQGKILGNKILEDGKTDVAVLYMNDAYGIGLYDNLKLSLEDGGASIVGEQIFEPSATDFTSAIQALLATSPDALVVISFNEITTIAEQLAGQGFDFSTLYGTDGNYGIIGEADTNVDIAGAQFTNPGVLAPEDFQTRLQDLVTEQGDPELEVFSYAAEAYDATVLSALAAIAGGATDGATIRDNLKDVSEGGTECTTFADCAALLADDASADIDYNGVSGPITFDDNGDPTEAYVSIFQYSTGNVSEGIDQVYGKL
ncbi:branched-chain amino acid transport system substrate-binding protein [Conyzicola lurida]|uniref:Branched-chain amino acid transport system substrate-binding protein n=1 Tax=Conyzicola lurida TaxID=1172621 RepID=A0A841AK79_9MICO|nr:ABC transporter substrate-binding protein [Conyzicola lurida]MBB5841875.1 branched-chain amino acid transport system substrate-binding protein [Conyzicola lurida]